MEAEEVATLRDDLARQLDGGLFTAPDAEQDAEEFGVGERGGPRLKEPLARPELGRELLYRVSARHVGIL